MSCPYKENMFTILLEKKPLKKKITHAIIKSSKSLEENTTKTQAKPLIHSKPETHI